LQILQTQVLPAQVQAQVRAQAPEGGVVVVVVVVAVEVQELVLECAWVEVRVALLASELAVSC
jgi:hypothetical protein